MKNTRVVIVYFIWIC